MGPGVGGGCIGQRTATVGIFAASAAPRPIPQEVGRTMQSLGALLVPTVPALAPAVPPSLYPPVASPAAPFPLAGDGFAMPTASRLDGLAPMIPPAVLMPPAIPMPSATPILLSTVVPTPQPRVAVAVAPLLVAPGLPTEGYGAEAIDDEDEANPVVAAVAAVALEAAASVVIDDA